VRVVCSIRVRLLAACPVRRHTVEGSSEASRRSTLAHRRAMLPRRRLLRLCELMGVASCRRDAVNWRVRAATLRLRRLQLLSMWLLRLR